MKRLIINQEQLDAENRPFFDLLSHLRSVYFIKIDFKVPLESAFLGFSGATCTRPRFWTYSEEQIFNIRLEWTIKAVTQARDILTVFRPPEFGFVARDTKNSKIRVLNEFLGPARAEFQATRGIFGTAAAVSVSSAHGIFICVFTSVTMLFSIRNRLHGRVYGLPVRLDFCS